MKFSPDISGSSVLDNRSQQFCHIILFRQGIIRLHCALYISEIAASVYGK